MAKKATQSNSTSVTSERSRRLFQLLKLLGAGAQTRASLTRRLRLGVRGFYRDLELLRAVGIEIQLAKGKYVLTEDVAALIDRLPFPDPGLNVGEARMLGKGKSPAHRRLREMLAQIEG